VSRFKFVVLYFFVFSVLLYAQTTQKWYSNLPERASLSKDKKTMNIGKDSYNVYNAFDPIAPKGGEKVLDPAGTLSYYMWLHNKDKPGTFTMSKIDIHTLLIYYYDEETGKYTNPNGKTLDK
jgi:hypothetical protein